MFRLELFFLEMFVTKLSICPIIHPKQLLFRKYLSCKLATCCSLPKVSFRADPASDWAAVHILSACRAVPAQVALISFANIASPSTTSYSPAPYHVTSQHALLLLGSPPPPPPVKLIQRSVVICKIIMLTPTQLPASDNVRLKFILFLFSDVPSAFIYPGTTYLCSLLCFKEIKLLIKQFGFKLVHSEN